MKGKIIPLPQAIGFILISNLCVCSLAYHLLAYYKKHAFEKYHDAKFYISSIIQNCPQRDTLSTIILSQMLELSKDENVNIFRFDVEVAQKKLLRYPMIEKAEIKIIKPSSIYVDYIMRVPVAFIGDFFNIAIDEDGIIFPYSPFYSPKVLPEIICGEHAFSEDESFFKKAIDQSFWASALPIIKTFGALSQDYPIRLRKIDFSRAQEKSLGMRELIIEIEQISAETDPKRFFHCLRLSPDHLEQSLGNYLVLLSKIRDEEAEIASAVDPMRELVIDFRISDTAIMTEYKQ